MDVPKIEFRYSEIYDYSLKTWTKSNKKNSARHYSELKILKYSNSVEKLWRKYEIKILRELSKITGLSWKEKRIVCYIVGNCIPFSDPLTLPIYKNKNDFIDCLVHELIHRLFTQKGNYEKSKKAWSYIFRKYKKERYNTIIHIPVHAVHSHIYIKFFGKNRMKRDKKNISFLKEYKRSWETVEKEDYGNITGKFKNLTQ